MHIAPTPSKRLFTAFASGIILCLLLAHTAQAASPSFSVTGADEQQQANISAWLSKLNESCELSPIQERNLLKKSRENTQQALQALGYYHADIDLHINYNKSCWQLQVAVIANDPVIIEEIDVQLIGEAQFDKAFKAMINASNIKLGDVLQHQHYEKLRNSLLSLSSDRGYFSALLEKQELRVDVKNNRASIHLHLNSGPRFYFGDVEFEQESLRDAFLQKFVPFKAGDPFDNHQLLNLRQDLAGSGYFSDVRIHTLKDQADDLQVPIRVSSKDKPRYVYTAGIGFATDTGPRVRFGVENRRVNSRGHRYKTGLEFSPVRSVAGINYEVPVRNPSKERFNYSSNYTHEDIDNKLSKRLRFGIAYLRELRSGWLSSYSLNWEREDYTVASQSDITYLLMPGFELTRIKADDAVYPRLGWKLNGSIRGAHEDVASSVSFVQFHGIAKGIFPTWYGRILMRIEGGASLADELIELPSSVRFFSGGDSTIRGYAYQSLGPKNAQGDVIGARHLLAASVEYEFPLTQRWYMAVFTDGGNAYDKLKDFEPVYGVGAGIRWRSPIGPIRLDVAHPTEGSSNFRIHISMGLDL